MSQPDDLLTQLREARPIAPAELREHVRRIAAEAAPRARGARLTWRRALVVARAGRRRGRGRRDPPARRREPAGRRPPACDPARRPLAARRADRRATGERNAARRPPRPTRPPSRRRARSRVQRITHLARAPRPEHAGRLRRDEAGGRDRPLARRLPDGAERRRRRAHRLRVRSSCASPSRTSSGPSSRLSALGTIVGENVRIQDLQAQVDATARKIERLEARLADWQAQPSLDRGADSTSRRSPPRSRSSAAAARATIRAASFATVSARS